MVDEREKPRSQFAERSHYLAALLDSLEDQISVIDRDGVIHYTNLAWDLFAEQNGMPKGYDWIGVNYTEVCDRTDEPLAQSAVEGIRRVLRRIQEKFCLEYPCHSPDTQRWFMMRVAPVVGIDTEFYAIAHTNITERKLLELEVASLSQHDPLTGLANRRLFNSFLHNEWRRSMREHTPLSLIMLDLDNFKACNDHFGHQVGDDLLRQVGHLLNAFCQRPADLPSRFGGDEFAVVLGNTGKEAALRMGEAIRLGIKELSMNELGDARLSASIGIATQLPERVLISEDELLAAADMALYTAKKEGKNRCHSVACPSLPNP
ncbi:GGDEF domain-containing protein [Aeromonas veronii]|uniref:diguanylate cyclase n=1 Tax=Aeromonas veronii TaxID=654 RepID=A0A6S5BUP1_AERVE|nr:MULTISPECIES: sensor domain-containing diguanylate cyclase [Aeromonas]MCE9953889.1 sensor domain-containing diguanylate cyclase [Aeromonas allosaccharophila]BBR40887.1 GGDEF domain-containing protein [Aeromonas veronii]